MSRDKSNDNDKKNAKRKKKCLKGNKNMFHGSYGRKYKTE